MADEGLHFVKAIIGNQLSRTFALLGIEQPAPDSLGGATDDCEL